MSRFDFTGERPELLEPRRVGEHVWIAAVAYRLSAETLRQASSADLDRENLATISVGCYVCEQPWSTRISHRDCPGHPVAEP